MLRLQLIATDCVEDDPLNYQSGERGPSLLNPTSTEPDQMGSEYLFVDQVVDCSLSANKVL